MKKMGRLYKQLKKNTVLALLFSCQKCICRHLCCLGLCIHSLMQTHLCALILAGEIRRGKRNYVCYTESTCLQKAFASYTFTSVRKTSRTPVTGPTDKVQIAHEIHLFHVRTLPFKSLGL